MTTDTITEEKPPFSNSYTSGLEDAGAAKTALTRLLNGDAKVAIVNPGPYGSGLLYKALLGHVVLEEVKDDQGEVIERKPKISKNNSELYEYNNTAENLIVVRSSRILTKEQIAKELAKENLDTNIFDGKDAGERIKGTKAEYEKLQDGNYKKIYYPVGGFNDQVTEDLDRLHRNKAELLSSHIVDKESVDNDLAYAIQHSDFVLLTDNSSSIENTLKEAKDLRDTLGRPNVVFGMVAKGAKSLEIAAEKYPDIVFLDGFHNANKLPNPIGGYLTDVNCLDATTALITSKILGNTMPGFSYKPSVETFANMHRCAAKNLHSLLCGFAQMYYESDFAGTIRRSAIDQINDQASIVAEHFRHDKGHEPKWGALKPKDLGNHYKNIEATLVKNGEDTSEKRNRTFVQDTATGLDVELSMSYPSEGTPTRNMRAGMLMGFYALIYKKIPTIDELTDFFAVSGEIGDAMKALSSLKPEKGGWTFDKVESFVALDGDNAERELFQKSGIVLSDEAKELLGIIKAKKEKGPFDEGISDDQIRKFSKLCATGTLNVKSLEGLKSIEAMPTFLEGCGIKEEDRTFTKLLQDAILKQDETAKNIMLNTDNMLAYIESQGTRTEPKKTDCIKAEELNKQNAEMIALIVAGFERSYAAPSAIPEREVMPGALHDDLVIASQKQDILIAS